MCSKCKKLVVYHLLKKIPKILVGNFWSVRTVPVGLPFQNFRLSGEFSSGTNQKNVYHLRPNRNFREFVVNGKQPSLEQEVLHENWTIFRGDIEKRIPVNFAVESLLKFTVFSKLKAERNFKGEVQNVTGPESKHR